MVKYHTVAAIDNNIMPNNPQPQLDKTQQEIEPPWVKYPEYPPGDTFWRQSGELWYIYVWLPYWESLSPDDQQAYLIRWQVPEVWRKYCADINFEFKQWLDSVDKE